MVIYSNTDCDSDFINTKVMEGCNIINSESDFQIEMHMYQDLDPSNQFLKDTAKEKMP